MSENKPEAHSRGVSFLLVGSAYVLAVIIVKSTLPFFQAHTLNGLYSGLYSDLLGTLAVYIFSFNLKNSSVFDGYWGAIPPFIVHFWNSISPAKDSTKNLLIMGVYFLFCARQLFFYYRSWPGLSYEEFRFQEWKDKLKSEVLYWIFSLFSIHIFSMGMVFLAIIPIYHCISASDINNYPLFIFGILLALSGCILEAVSDQQLHAFRSRKVEGQCIQEGLWRYSRHPNYLGEITFWWGWYIASLGASQDYWKDGFGALLINIVFLTYSIPSMEKKLEKREAYKLIQDNVSKLILWPRKDSKNDKKD